jgi:hypothetical protein
MGALVPDRDHAVNVRAIAWFLSLQASRQEASVGCHFAKMIEGLSIKPWAGSSP